MTVSAFPDKTGTTAERYRTGVLVFLGAALPMIVIPYVHFGIFYRLLWVPDKPKIDRDNCKCGCFDTIFKGTYEKPGDVGYKHMYFNSTWQTYCMWLLTVLFLLASYESTKYLITLGRGRHLRPSMLALFLINIYPNYYAWWAFVGYYNDDLYTLYRHDLYFMVTELITTLTVLWLCDRRREIAIWNLLVIISISTMHILVGGMDQFVVQLFFGEGADFLRVRNVGLMIPDFVMILTATWELYKCVKRRKEPLAKVINRNHLIASSIFIAVGTVFGRYLW